MTTSGSIDYNQTRNEIIFDALQIIGVYGIGRTVSAEDEKFAASMLNKMVKAWQKQGLHMWAYEEAYLFAAKDGAEYSMGNASTDARAALRTDTVFTELGADEAASQTSITVDSTTDMTAADIIGIELNDGTTHWSTIASITDSTTLVIDDALASAASTNRNVYTFTTRINKPLRIPSMRRKSGIGDSSTTIPMLKLSQQEYFDLPNKAMSGVPSHYYYNPDISNGRLYVWPRPQNSEYHFEFTFERMLEDFDASTDNADFPVEWLECITYQLAYRIAGGFGKDKNTVMPEAGVMLENMLDADHEATSMYLMPNRDY